MRKAVRLKKYAVPIEKLRWVCPQDIFAFECTSDIEPLKEFIGQTRAIDSILAVERPGYNLFLTGLTGTGKAATIKAHSGGDGFAFLAFTPPESRYLSGYCTSGTGSRRKACY